MPQIPVQFLISFETLAETVLALELDDQLRLHTLLAQAIERHAAQPLQEEALLERGVHFPLKIGLAGTAELIKSDRVDVSVNHDQVVAQDHWGGL